MLKNWRPFYIDYLTGDNYALDEMDVYLEENQFVESEIGDITYILNTDSKKFHNITCGSAKNMSEENKLETSLTREEIVTQGYDPCGICKP